MDSTSGGVLEAEITDSVIALQGSGTADAPNILINLDTTATSNILVAYNVRDIDGAVDNAIQPVALHYRVGSSGSWTNVAGAFIPDATTGPSLATLVTPVSVTLPSNADNQSLVQIRVITSNAVGSDEWVGIDDISITGSIADAAPTVTGTVPTDTATDVTLDANIDITFSEAVSAPDGAYTIECATSGSHTFTGATSDNITYTLDPADNYVYGEVCTVTVLALGVSDIDTEDPPNNMAADHVFTFTTLFDHSTCCSEHHPTQRCLECH